MDLRVLVDRAEVTDVLARYARGVDRRDWDLVGACYHDDAHDDHGLYSGGKDGLIEFLRRLSTQFISTTHHLGTPLIDVAADEARVETTCLAWYRRARRDGAERSVAQGLRYLDRLERRDGRWAISDRLVVLDWEHVFEPGPVAAIDPAWSRGAAGPDDPSSARIHTRSALDHD